METCFALQACNFTLQSALKYIGHLIQQLLHNQWLRMRQSSAVFQAFPRALAAGKSNADLQVIKCKNAAARGCAWIHQRGNEGPVHSAAFEESLAKCARLPSEERGFEVCLPAGPTETAGVYLAFRQKIAVGHTDHPTMPQMQCSSRMRTIHPHGRYVLLNGQKHTKEVR